MGPYSKSPISDSSVAPTIAGTLQGQTTNSQPTVPPFANVTIGDRNANATDTLTITLSGAGTLADGAGFSSLVGGTGGVHRLAGSAAVITSELDALVFTPAAGVSGPLAQNHVHAERPEQRGRRADRRFDHHGDQWTGRPHHLRDAVHIDGAGRNDYAVRGGHDRRFERARDRYADDHPFGRRDACRRRGLQRPERRNGRRLYLGWIGRGDHVRTRRPGLHPGRRAAEHERDNHAHAERRQQRLCDAGGRQFDDGDGHGSGGHPDHLRDAQRVDDVRRGCDPVRGGHDRRLERQRHGHPDDRAFGRGTLADGRDFSGLSGEYDFVSGFFDYTLAGSAAAITSELDALVFTRPPAARARRRPRISNCETRAALTRIPRMTKRRR